MYDEGSKKDFAKSLRSRSTPAEKVLWNCLRSRRLCGLKFKRQVPIGPYVADFCCEIFMWIVEVDGATHLFRRGYETKRERFLQERGFRVLHVANLDVLNNRAAVLRTIAWACGLSIED